MIMVTKISVLISNWIIILHILQDAIQHMLSTHLERVDPELSRAWNARHMLNRETDTDTRSS